MKRHGSIIIILAALALSASARDINLNVDYTLSTQPGIFWYQAEQVNLFSSFVNPPPGLDAPDAQVSWDITAASGAPLYLSVPCTIASNFVTAALQPTNSNFDPGSYRGYLRLENGSTNLVLSRQRINVYWSTAGGTYPSVGPLAIIVPSSGVFRVSLSLTNSYSAAIVDDQLQLNVNTNTGLTTVDWSHLDPELSNAIANAETGGGTTLQKSGVDLNGTYKLGAGISVNGSTIEVVQSETEAFTVLGTPEHGKLISYQGAPYNAPAYVAGAPSVGDGIWYNGTNWYYGPQSYTQSQAYGITIGTNKAVYEFTGLTNEFIVPLGVSNLLVKLWGSAGANGDTASRGGSGGYVSGYFPVSPGEALTIVVGGGVGFSYQTAAFGYGGRAGRYFGAGGGGSYIFRDSNLLCCAGGGGGGTRSSGGSAGGLVGNSSGNAGGGTQFAGGAAGGGNATDGYYLCGGTGDWSGPGGGGGGGGYYGGGGGYSAGGGGGSAYIAHLSYAATYSFNMPYDDDYVAGVGAVSASTYSHGGPGLVVIRW